MRVLIVIIVLVEVTLALPPRFATSGGETYLNNRIVDVNVTSEEERQYVNSLADVGNMGLDIWLYPTLKKTGRMRVPPESIDLFMDLMKKSGISAKIMHNNLKQLNDEVNALPRSPVNYNDFIEGIIRHDNYYRFASIDGYLTGLAGLGGATKRYFPQTTIEGRSTPYLEITGGTGSNKKRIFIEAGMHAREWVSPASALYFIDRLLHRRYVDSDASELYNNFDWYIVPVANPDGYEYTHTTSRYWRKNRRHVPGCSSSVYGVDLNRNFDAMWGGSGSSGSCSSDIYRGPSAFSEFETSNIRDKVQEIKREQGPIHAYLSIHSFSQLLLTPYGFAANTYPPNINNIMSITNAAKDAIKNAYGKDYVVGSPADILYNADGGSHDWARLTEDIQYAMTYELRPENLPGTGLNGFHLPTSEIAPCSKEVWDSIYAIATRLPA